jgi:hypothetical protein
MLTADVVVWTIPVSTGVNVICTGALCTEPCFFVLETADSVDCFAGHAFLCSLALCQWCRRQHMEGMCGWTQMEGLSRGCSSVFERNMAASHTVPCTSSVVSLDVHPRLQCKVMYWQEYVQTAPCIMQDSSDGHTRRVGVCFIQYLVHTTMARC